MGAAVEQLTVFRLPPPFTMTQEHFFDFCRIYPDLKLELNASGEVKHVPPGWDTSVTGVEVLHQLMDWSDQFGGRVAGANLGVNLPNGATRSPSALWVSDARFAQFPANQHDRFLPFCPDFVAEVHSGLVPLRHPLAKMREYLENGARLAWLVDPLEETIHIYRPGHEPVTLTKPTRLDASPELPGFVLDLTKIWEA